MPRAFCVLVNNERYNCKEKKLEIDMQNFHVLVGPKEKIDAMKEKLKPFHEGGWKVTERTHET